MNLYRLPRREIVIRNYDQIVQWARNDNEIATFKKMLSICEEFSIWR